MLLLHPDIAKVLLGLCAERISCRLYSRIFSRIQLKGPCILANESEILMAAAEIEPYSFEPMRDHSDSDEDFTENADEIRRGNTLWCNCGRCENWENQQERECQCCQEIEEAVTKISGEIIYVQKMRINFFVDICINRLISFIKLNMFRIVQLLVFTSAAIHCFGYLDQIWRQIFIPFVVLPSILVSIQYACKEKCWRLPLLA